MRPLDIAFAVAIGAAAAPALAQPQPSSAGQDVKSITGTNGALERGWANMSLPRDTIKQAQEKLKNLGYYKGGQVVDGVWGPETGTAVRRFQDSKHLPTTGDPDAKTLAALGIAAPAPAAGTNAAEAGSGGTAQPSATAGTQSAGGGATATPSSPGGK